MFALKSMKEREEEGTALAVQSIDFDVLSTYLREMLGNIRLVLAGGDLEVVWWFLSEWLDVK